MEWFTSLATTDKAIKAALIIHGVALVGTVLLALDQWRSECETKPPQPKPQYITQDTEDALKLTTLDTLLCHYNHAIRETAVKIVCDRAVNDKDTLDQLLWGITRPNYDERMKNLRALAVITDPRESIILHGVTNDRLTITQDSLDKLHTWKAYAALVRSLELSLDPDQEVLDSDDWDEYPLRDMTEKLCLMFISQLVNTFDCEKLVKAKFVEKWLSKQNWGNTEDERQQNFSAYLRSKTNRLAEIMNCIRRSPAGREALQKCGLFPYSDVEDSEPDNDDTHLVERFGVLFPETLDVNSLDANHPTRVLLRSFQTTQTGEDQRDRNQRHREAMVLNDGSHPVTSDDIIQRDPASPA
ncbi:hypothetical protein QBC36DRAFT_10387 [Triangularia setosa]|uniref:Cytoskeleton-associated protein n=1 Tax=Triangularia setosa TaxID=2587417 RepID=A0AAN6W6K6_9PEZI|nr:hypothetical protein QBC36DRAFT_10387 [Podospora setosa]